MVCEGVDLRFPLIEMRCSSGITNMIGEEVLLKSLVGVMRTRKLLMAGLSHRLIHNGVIVCSPDAGSCKCLFVDVEKRRNERFVSRDDHFR